MTKSSDNGPIISLIVPCYNEERFLPAFLESLRQQSLSPLHFELIVLDGMSTDKSRDILRAYAKYFPHFCLEDNPARYVPQALNKGIQIARSSYIARMDVHTTYPPDYLEQLLFWQQKTGADNIGGLCQIVPRSSSSKALAIALALAHPLGVGNSTFRTGTREVKEVDTVPFGFFPKATFEKFGLFDERLIRNQDIEYNKRILRQGGKIILVPAIQCQYFARDRFSQLWKNMFDTGKWVIRAVRLTGRYDALSGRHFVPMLFVLYLLSVPMALFWGGTATPIFGIPAGFLAALYLLPFLFYLLSLFAVGLQLALQRRRPALLWFLPYTFFLMHLAYGLGSWYAVIKTKH